TDIHGAPSDLADPPPALVTRDASIRGIRRPHRVLNPRHARGPRGTMTTHRAAIAIVGAGPRGTGLLERIAAGVPELLPGVPLDVHLVDPFPAGAGRIWRHAQSPLLAMNSMAADVTMFTDDSVHCEGPIVPGPSMWEWAQDLREGRLPGEDL